MRFITAHLHYGRQLLWTSGIRMFKDELLGNSNTRILALVRSSCKARGLKQFEHYVEHQEHQSQGYTQPCGTMCLRLPMRLPLLRQSLSIVEIVHGNG